MTSSDTLQIFLSLSLSLYHSAMRDQYMRTAEGYLLVFSVDNLKSVEELETYLAEIQRVKDSDNIPILRKHDKRM